MIILPSILRKCHTAIYNLPNIFKHLKCKEKSLSGIKENENTVLELEKF